VRLHRRLRPADALAEHDGERETCCTGVDVDNRRPYVCKRPAGAIFDD
jgi:hypothetical protein